MSCVEYHTPDHIKILNLYLFKIGWNDGTVRAFTPQTGSQMFTIHNAHNKGVSAVAITKDNSKVVSGGGEGQVIPRYKYSSFRYFDSQFSDLYSNYGCSKREYSYIGKL